MYLEKPNKDIDFELGENANFKFAAGGMQGWRINMVSLGGPASKQIKSRSSLGFIERAGFPRIQE